MNLKMKTWFLSLLMSGALIAQAADTNPLYENNFDKAEVEKVPDEFLVLDGAFAVKQDGAGRVLELPGAPLDTFGVLFGPTETNGLAVSARIHGTGKGRRFPTFAVGLNGVGGYRLQVSPGKKLLEIFKGDDVLASVPFTWESGAWTQLRLQSRKVKDGEFKVEGKAWKAGGAEPKEWQISQSVTEAVPSGRASVWGNPYAGTPIRYDDLKVWKAAP